MAHELTMLVWAVVLTLVQCVVPVLGATRQVGLPKLAGNREGLGEMTGWTGRGQRAHRNMLESLPLFAALVLVAVVAGRTNATTALGADLFFWGRLAYAVVYIAGITWLRTLLWFVSIAGIALLISQLLSF